MRLHTKQYPIWYAEIEIDRQQAYNLVVDALCDYTGDEYSFRFKIRTSTFLDAIEGHIVLASINNRADNPSAAADAKQIIEQARFMTKQKGIDVLIFVSVKEITPVRELKSEYEQERISISQLDTEWTCPNCNTWNSLASVFNFSAVTCEECDYTYDVADSH